MISFRFEVNNRYCFIFVRDVFVMKLLILNYEYPPLGGGAGVISASIAEGLAERGHEVTVITTWFKGEEDVSVKENLRIIRLKSKRRNIYKSNPLEMWSWIKITKMFLRKHLLKERYDLCFANFALPGGEVAYSMKYRYRLPYAIISHGHDIPWFFPEQMFWYHLFTYHWIRNICLQSERNFIQSQDMKNNIDAFLGKKHEHKNIIIHNGWNTTYFKPDFSKRKQKFTIIFPGRLVKQKDPMSFLKAIKLVRERILDFEVIILGDGKLRKKMEEFSLKNGLKDIVVFKSWVDKYEMLENYQSASLTVLPSLDEGMSIATLEALACGQYVITTDVSRNAELIKPGYNGDLVSKKNPNILAARIIDFYNEKFLHNYRISLDELESYHKLYEWNEIIDKYETEFMKITEQFNYQEAF